MLYLLKVSGCLIVFYLIYLIIYRRDAHFKGQRVFLMVTLALSLALPFNRVSLRRLPPAQIIDYVQKDNNSAKKEVVNASAAVSVSGKNFEALPTGNSSLNFLSILKWIYFCVALLLLIRVFFGFAKAIVLILQAKQKYLCNTKVYVTSQVNSTTTIFGFIFLNPEFETHSDLSKIITHETIHASQYHSFDILLIELLAAATWFNPVVWLMRRSLQQLHEYLADEGVLRSGVNKLEYQTLLVNHIAEDNLVLSSSFNSSIKNRISMMTQNNVRKYSKLKVFALMPAAACLIIGISWINPPVSDETAKQTNHMRMDSKPALLKESKAPELKEQLNLSENNPTQVSALKSGKESATPPQDPPVAAVALTKMNVLYLGVDNPVTIAISNHSPSEIKVSVDNGTILKMKESSSYYIMRPKQVGMATLSVSLGDKVIEKLEFRVKRVPDPVAKVAGKKSGKISREDIIKAGKVEADMENFDFDLRFTVVSFTISFTKDGNVLQETSKSNSLTKAQMELLAKAEPGQKVYIEDIKCAGPDGGIRSLSPLALEIE